MATYETLNKKAEKLLKLGDAQSYLTAKGRATLRACLRYRRKAAAAKQKSK